MNLSLTRAERVVISQIVSMGLNNATLKEHLLYDKMYTSIDIENIDVPVASDFVKPEEVELFEKYNKKPISEIEDPDHKKIIQEAMQKQRQEEAKMWANEEEALNFDLSADMVSALKKFFEQDKRPFPREYHQAIVSLNGKLFGDKK
jgi:hypothetical protein